MNEIKWAALAAAGLLAVAPEAQATATATATLGNFQYQLFDLDPGDGIAASVSFDRDSNLYSFARDTATTFSNGTSTSAFGAIGSPLSVSASQGLSFASAQMTAGIPTNATTNATTTGFGSSAQANAYAVNAKFTLSPRTLLVFSAQPSNLVATTSVLGESSSASVQVSLRTTGLLDPQQSDGLAYVNAHQDGSTSSFLPISIIASFTNLTGASVIGDAYAYAYSGVSVTSAPVPEPQSYALMLAGLLAVGALARSRRSR